MNIELDEIVVQDVSDDVLEEAGGSTQRVCSVVIWTHEPFDR